MMQKFCGPPEIKSTLSVRIYVSRPKERVSTKQVLIFGYSLSDSHRKFSRYRYCFFIKTHKLLHKHCMLAAEHVIIIMFQQNSL